MAKEKKKFEYFVKETTPGNYEVTKFDSMAGGEQPLAMYHVKYDPPRQLGKCECWPGRRGAGPTDKHVRIVVQWIESGKTAMAILW